MSNTPIHIINVITSSYQYVSHMYAVGGGTVTKLSLDADDKYLLDHKVNSQALYPAAGLVWCAWDALAKNQGKQLSETPATITNMEIITATMLYRNGNNTSEFRTILFLYIYRVCVHPK